MTKFARRMDKIELSGIRRIFDLVQGMTDAVDLSLGQPHFDPPKAVREAAKAAIDKGHNRYTVTQGIAPLREKLAGAVAKHFGLKDAPILVTNGTAGGLFLSLAVLVEEGDEVLVPDPCFGLYRHLVHFFGGTPVMVDTYPEFRLTPGHIERAATKKTRWMIFNNPVNPTGIAYRKDEVEAIAAVCRKKGIFVISDEIYDAFSFDYAHSSLPRLMPEQSLLLAGFSKTYGIPGWRLGYAAGPAEIVDKMTMLSQFTYVCAPAPLQVGAVAALDVDMSKEISAYRRKRDLVYEGLKDRYDVVKPQGAFYLFPKCPWGTDQEFVKKAIASKLLVVPGSACSMRGTHFRISFAAEDAELKRGVGILNRIARK